MAIATPKSNSGGAGRARRVGCCAAVIWKRARGGHPRRWRQQTHGEGRCYGNACWPQFTLSAVLILNIFCGHSGTRFLKNIQTLLRTVLIAGHMLFETPQSSAALSIRFPGA